MKCSWILEQMSEYLTDELAVADRDRVDEHLAQCPSCRKDYGENHGLLGLLDAVPPATVSVNVNQIYRMTTERQRRVTQRYRRAFVAMSAVAAILALVFSLQLHIRWEKQALVIGWGTPPVEKPKNQEEKPLQAPKTESYVSDDEMRLARKLIHALALEIERLDQQQGVEIDQLRREWSQMRVFIQQHYQHILARHNQERRSVIKENIP